jgi:predicted nucleic acid-binding protein
LTSIFVDTGAWFARFVPCDVDHAVARQWFENNTLPLVTTEYVVDELLTVLKMRGEYQRALEVGPSKFNGEICHLEWVTQAGVKDA